MPRAADAEPALPPGLGARGGSEPLRVRAGRAAPALAVALAAAALLVATGSFAWGAVRTLHGDVLPRLALLLALVIAARALRRPRLTSLFESAAPRGLWRERLGALTDAALVLVAVAAALEQAGVLLRGLLAP